ncbi:hypothetical protein D9613_008294 [Agrocybe pediades]|uniref:Uncharacterized protein n=1 Tax=Agrocybe pediades TaxID=84607 RepID=A0A8H4QTL5_9AGAR|nr:hypothetical protein D9613_008294 [Agrocybe pediades]
MSSTSNKRRRANTTGAASKPKADADAGTDQPSLSRLNQLMTEALKTAKAIQPTRSDGPAIKKAHTLANSLLKAIPADITLKTIAFDEHKASFDAEVKALQRHCKRDYHDGYDEQTEMMEDLSKSIVEWLVELWELMQEPDMDLKVIEKCFVLAEYTDLDFKVKIVNDNGKVVYKGDSSVNRTLGWLWRELLIIATTRGLPIKTMLASIERFRLTDEVYDLFRESHVDDDADMLKYCKFWDGHWSDDMKAAAARVFAAKPA